MGGSSSTSACKASLSSSLDYCKSEINSNYVSYCNNMCILILQQQIFCTDSKCFLHLFVVVGVGGGIFQNVGSLVSKRRLFSSRPPEVKENELLLYFF